jgi:hypothetical protein
MDEQVYRLVDFQNYYGFDSVDDMLAHILDRQSPEVASSNAPCSRDPDFRSNEGIPDSATAPSITQVQPQSGMPFVSPTLDMEHALPSTDWKSSSSPIPTPNPPLDPHLYLPPARDEYHIPLLPDNADYGAGVPPFTHSTFPLDDGGMDPLLYGLAYDPPPEHPILEGGYGINLIPQAEGKRKISSIERI